MVFATLTYNDKTLPPGNQLEPKDVQAFWKRLRARLHPQTVRYYVCGEYGDRTGRPHYHAAIFGAGFHHADQVLGAWKLGNVHIGELNAQSIAYNCAHITKAAHKFGDPRLDGRHPEFQRSTKKPYGLGAGAMSEIAKWLQTEQGAKFIAESGDVNTVFRMDGQIWPLAPYLRRRLRKAVGMDENQPSRANEMQGRQRQAEAKVNPDVFEIKRVHDGRLANQKHRQQLLRKTL